MKNKIYFHKPTKKMKIQIGGIFHLNDIYFIAIFIIIIVILLFIPDPKLIKIITTLLVGSVLVIILIPVKNSNHKLYQYLYLILKNKLTTPVLDYQTINLSSKIMPHSDHQYVHKFACKNILIFQLKTTNFDLLNDKEKKLFLDNFSHILQAFNHPYSLLKTDNFSTIDAHLEKINNHDKSSWLTKNIAYMEDIKATLAPHGCIYLVFINQHHRELSKIYDYIKQQMNSNYFTFLPLKSTACQAMFHELTPPFNNKLTVQKKSIITEEYGTFTHMIDEFPFLVAPNFLNALINEPNVRFTLNINQIPKEMAKKKLDNAKSVAYAEANRIKKQSQSNQLEFELFEQSLADLQNKIVSDEDVLLDTNLYINCIGDQNRLNSLAHFLKKFYSLHNLAKVKTLNYEQFNGILSFLPNGLDLFNKKYSFEIGTENLTALGPYACNNISLTDIGFIIGNDFASGQPISFEPFAIDKNHRRNYNMAIFGNSGSGKSFLLKNLLKNALVGGKKIIIIDPENEYQILAKEFNGNIIDMASTDHVINPLQVFEMSTNAPQINLIYTNQIHFIINFLKLLWPQLATEMAIIFKITAIIQQVYEDFRIFTSIEKLKSLKNTDFPIFTDIYQAALTTEYATLSEKTFIIQIFKNLSCPGGIYAAYWNKHTKFKADHNLTIFSFKKLKKAKNSDSMFGIQANLLFHILNSFFFDRKSLTNADQLTDMIICFDEMHLFLDDRNPEILKMISGMVRRARKYHTGIWCATQSLKDFEATSSANSKEFAGIINNCQYKFYGSLEQKEIDMINIATQGSGGLNEYESQFLYQATKGMFYFEKSKYEKNLIQIAFITEH